MSAEPGGQTTLGDDGPVTSGCVRVLHVVSDVAHSLFCGLVSQGCVGHDRARVREAAALSELIPTGQ